jgi:hypothetical protein
MRELYFFASAIAADVGPITNQPATIRVRLFQHNLRFSYHFLERKKDGYFQTLE